MSTRYTVDITESGGHFARLIIDISVIPGQSEWMTEQPGIFSIDNGPMLNDFNLMGLGVTPVAFLTGFPGNKSGKGEKNDPGGTFPAGKLNWKIVPEA